MQPFIYLFFSWTNQLDFFADFRALIEKYPSWKEKVTSQAKLKKVQLEPAQLGLITSI